MELEDHELQPATVLRGHVSPDTAYLVEDYPYGYTLRCQIRYWLHTADRGTAVGRVRLMSQTTNPKHAGEFWNKPKASTYYPWAVMIRDSRDYICWWPVGDWGPTPWGHLHMELRTVYQQLTSEERSGYDKLLQRRTAHSDSDWERAQRAYELISDGATRDELFQTHHLYVSEREYAIGLAANSAGVRLA